MITKRQKEVLDFISDYTSKKGYAPSLEDIQRRFKLASVSTAHFHVSGLKESGYLERVENKARSITVTARTNNVEILLMGRIAAGGPIEAIRNPEPIEVPRSMLSGDANYYALEVTGTSMIEEGISDGDIIIVREQQTVDDGEKAVAYLPDKDAVTLKKIYREQNRVKLMPANHSMKPFYVDNIEIQGKVVGVLRSEV
jgi:repressor LexA